MDDTVHISLDELEQLSKNNLNAYVPPCATDDASLGYNNSSICILF